MQEDAVPALAALRDLVEAGLLWRRRKRDPRLLSWNGTTEGFLRAPKTCIICGWAGAPFIGRIHCESSECPRCGSIARDRFLFYCLVERLTYRHGLRVLETSPRLGRDYREAMSRRFTYLASDFEQKSHQGNLVLDLQHVGLRDDSIDVVLTAHVLEHVPDTDTMLSELWRVLAPGGTLFLSVPVLQGSTAPPAEPEYHGDNTLVFWRFGFDLTHRLRKHGFKTSVLVTDEFKRLVGNGNAESLAVSPEFDVPAMLQGANHHDMVAVASDSAARLQGFQPCYMYVVWECAKPQ